MKVKVFIDYPVIIEIPKEILNAEDHFEENLIDYCRANISFPEGAYIRKIEEGNDVIFD